MMQCMRAERLYVHFFLVMDCLESLRVLELNMGYRELL